MKKNSLKRKRAEIDSGFGWKVYIFSCTRVTSVQDALKLQFFFFCSMWETAFGTLGPFCVISHYLCHQADNENLNSFVIISFLLLYGLIWTKFSTLWDSRRKISQHNSTESLQTSRHKNCHTQNPNVLCFWWQLQFQWLNGNTTPHSRSYTVVDDISSYWNAGTISSL